MRLFTAIGERKMISFSNSHFLLGSLSSYYATNLKLCQSRTSAVRQTPPPSQAQKRNVQDVHCPSRLLSGLALSSAADIPDSRSTSDFLVKSALSKTKEPSQTGKTSRLISFLVFSFLSFSEFFFDDRIFYLHLQVTSSIKAQTRTNEGRK